MELTDAHRRAMSRLAIDRATAEVVSALADRGIPSHLLKGPTFTAAFYDAGEERHYTDIDLLVPPQHEVAAAAVLGELGWDAVFGRWETDHAWAHRREHDGVWLDLHRSVSGCRGPSAVVHRVLTRDDDVLRLAGVDVPVLGWRGRLLHAAIHAGRNGAGNARSLDDLRRAIDRATPEDWQSVHAMATTVGAVESLTAGLALVPAGREVLDELALDADDAAPSRDAVPLVGGLDRWAAASWVGRLRLLLALLLPSRGQLLVRFPWAARSGWHRAAAAASWPIWLAVALPRAVLARRARAEVTEG